MWVLRLFVLLSVVCLVGCKLSSPKPEDTTTTSNTLELTVSSPHQADSDSFPNSDEVTITAHLLDASKNPVKSAIVKLSSTLGTLASEQVLTDATGFAKGKIAASDVLGAGTITATYGTVSAQYNFELLAPVPPEPVASPHLTLSLLNNGVSVNRFKSNDAIQLRALVTDADNQPLSNVIVKFTVELGTTSVPSALTDQNGIAEVTLKGSDANLGAAQATASATLDTASVTKTLNYEVINSAITIVEQVIKLGHFDSNNQFVEGSLGASVAADSKGVIPISAGGSLGISLAIVDENNARIMAPSQVTFSSNCVTAQRARIDSGIGTINGVATTTYEDIRCGGGQDVIEATVTVNNLTKSLTQTISIAPETIGSIEFVSASPTSIVLKGTGGQGQQEASTLTFLVKGALGNPLAQQAVSFSLNTSAGNLNISPATSLTNSLGLVTARVNAGNVPTSVRVTAAVSTATNEVIQTQSDLLSVNTGMPDQDSFSIAPETLNPEADADGIEDVVTVRLADSFNNPVPDGTTVNFTAEGGSIVPSCNTVKGACSVKWTSGEPRVADHRVTILATAVGHETFYDTNGSNTFDDADGVGVTSTAESGLGRLAAAASGFFDMSEAWRDDNENGVYDAGEKFIDFNNDQQFNARDSLFNGPQCQGSLCGTGVNKSIHVRKATVISMAGSEAKLTLMSLTAAGTANPTVPHVAPHYVYKTNDNLFVDGGNLTIAEDGSESFRVLFSDDGAPYGQTLPKGTTVTVSADQGTLSGETTYTVGNAIVDSDPNKFNGQSLDFTITNTNTTAVAGEVLLRGTLTVTVTTPQSTVSKLVFAYDLSGT